MLSFSPHINSTVVQALPVLQKHLVFFCNILTHFEGVLVIRKSLITHSRPPTQPGGGTVYFVSSQHVRYMPVAEEREEAGTPNTLGCVRAGLAFALKVCLAR